jgi:hypothetical protein
MEYFHTIVGRFYGNLVHIFSNFVNFALIWYILLYLGIFAPFRNVAPRKIHMSTMIMHKNGSTFHTEKVKPYMHTFEWFDHIWTRLHFGWLGDFFTKPPCHPERRPNSSNLPILLVSANSPLIEKLTLEVWHTLTWLGLLACHASNIEKTSRLGRRQILH